MNEATSEKLSKHGVLLARQLRMFLTIVIALISTVCLGSPENASEKALRELAEKFLQAEFEGVIDKRTIDAGLVYINDNLQFDADRVLSYENDEAVIVTSVKVVKVSINANTATVKVDANKIGSLKNIAIGRVKVVADRQEHHMFELKYKKFGDRWLIVKPPLPRVSQVALYAYYRDGILDTTAEAPKISYSKEQIAEAEYAQKNKKAIKALVPSGGQPKQNLSN